MIWQIYSNLYSEKHKVITEETYQAIIEKFINLSLKQVPDYSWHFFNIFNEYASKWIPKNAANHKYELRS
jgi:hypothetical protein